MSEGEAVNFSELKAEPVEPPVTDFVTPNHKASKPERRLFRGPVKERRQPVKKPPVPNRAGQFIEPLTKMYSTGAMVMMPFDPVCAQAVMANAEQCARAWDELAQRNEAIRRALHSLVTTSAWGTVLVAHAPIIMAVAMHHMPAAQQIAGKLGAEMMEEMLKQENESTDNA